MFGFRVLIGQLRFKENDDPYGPAIGEPPCLLLSMLTSASEARVTTSPRGSVGWIIIFPRQTRRPCADKRARHLPPFTQAALLVFLQAGSVVVHQLDLLVTSTEIDPARC